MEDKTCQQCSINFEITDDDLEFYQKVSPIFAGKKYDIPSPVICPDCRQQRRASWRNDNKLYKRKCDKTGKDIISIYSSDKPYKVYEQPEWYKDDWDAIQYGIDFDFSRGFRKQYKELFDVVPKSALRIKNCENCEFNNAAIGSKDCYMSVIVDRSERCIYSYWMLKCKDSVDCLFIQNCELCYECVSAVGCYNSSFLQSCENVSNSFFMYDCKSCESCFGCVGLRNKSYYWFNEQLSKEEYEGRLKKVFPLTIDKINKYIKELADLKKGFGYKYANVIGSENCVGDDIVNCKNCDHCFGLTGSEDVKYCYDADALFDSQDVFHATMDTSLCYDSHAIIGGRYLFSNSCWESNSMIYCDNCYNCQDCLGCVGLRNKQYCVFNKQYSQEEYEELAGKIIEKMQAEGEWGQFFPISMSPFGYNETMANYYYPLNKEEAAKLGAKWQDNDYGIKYDGLFYEPHEDINKYVSSQDEVDKLLAGILKCSVSGKPFRIMPVEMVFYLKQKLPIPNKHYDVRFQERFNMSNPRKLYKRQCDCILGEHGHDNNRCPNEFETTYAPDRKESVYCEGCYRKSVI
ncbi:hypothetical protein KJ855_01495 [Patescibacteria group bacterium]|nr:hypothetical protein [Patescibacteria group bacterium]